MISFPDLEKRAVLIRYYHPNHGGKFTEGTGFTSQFKGKRYLITARHLFEDEGATRDPQNLEDLSKIKAIKLHQNKNWLSHEVKVEGPPNCEADLIVFSLKVDIPDQEPWEIVNAQDEISCGQDAYFLGFPFGRTSDFGSNQSIHPTPFIRKGLISGKVNSDPCRAWVLDATSDDGFSGGPVFVNTSKDIHAPNFKVIGINACIQSIDLPLKNENRVPFERYFVEAKTQRSSR